MKQLPLIPDSDDEQKPLPLIVAQRWNFPLAHVQTDTGMMYAVQDWMRGLSGEQDVRRLWDMFKRLKRGMYCQIQLDSGLIKLAMAEHISLTM